MITISGMIIRTSNIIPEMREGQLELLINICFVYLVLSIIS